MPLTYKVQDIGNRDGSVKSITYTGLSEADTSPEDFEFVEYADKSVQVIGTFAGGTVSIEGSNNGSDWAVLTDPQGNPLTFTTAKIEQIEEFTRFVRPRVTSGTGLNIVVVFVVRRQNNMRT